MSATTALVQDDVDLQAVEAEVTTIFERYLQQDSEGRWSVNVEAVRQDGAPEAELQRIAEGFNVPIGTYVFPGSEDKEAGGKGASPQHQFGSWEWGKCVLNIAVPGAGTMLIDGAIRGLLARAKYELRQRHFPQVVIFIICMVFLLATIMTAISWITIPRATIMASVLIVGLTAAMAYKTFVAQNIAYSTNFTIVCSLILMAGIAGAQWGTEKFMPALIATLTVSAIMTIRQARSTSSRIRP